MPGPVDPAAGIEPSVASLRRRETAEPHTFFEEDVDNDTDTDDEPSTPRMSAAALYSAYNDPTLPASERESAFVLLFTRDGWQAELNDDEIRRTMAIAHALDDIVLEEEVRLATEAAHGEGRVVRAPVNYPLAFVWAHILVRRGEMSTSARDGDAAGPMFWILEELKVDAPLTRQTWATWSATIQRLLVPHPRAIGILLRDIHSGHPDYAETLDLQLGTLITPTVGPELQSVVQAVRERSEKGSDLWQALAEHCQGEQTETIVSLRQRFNEVRQRFYEARQRQEDRTLDHNADRFRELLYECSILLYQIQNLEQIAQFRDRLGMR